MGDKLRPVDVFSTEQLDAFKELVDRSIREPEGEALGELEVLNDHYLGTFTEAVDRETSRMKIPRIVRWAGVLASAVTGRGLGQPDIVSPDRKRFEIVNSYHRSAVKMQRDEEAA
jgi:hypothetical protein